MPLLRPRQLARLSPDEGPVAGQWGAGRPPPPAHAPPPGSGTEGTSPLALTGPVAPVTAGGSQRLLLGRGRRCGEPQSRVVAGSQLKGKNADEGVSASPRLPAASGRRYCAAFFTETGA